MHNVLPAQIVLGEVSATEAPSLQQVCDHPIPVGLPSIFRVLSVDRYPDDDARSFRFKAALFHEQAELSVTWRAQYVDTRIVCGSLVSIRWLLPTRSLDGSLRIARLVLIERPVPAVNLFHLTPRSWVKDRDWVLRASQVWEALPRGFQHLFNAIFWEGKRFRRYVMGPSSINDHHPGINGNLRHSVDVAERAVEMASRHPEACIGVLLMGALLHDAGKADEYSFDYSRQTFVLSERGMLIGHKHTVLEWMAAAKAVYRVIVPDAHYLSLEHALTASKGAADWLGLREPRTIEATILSMADRLSGEGDLITRLAPKKTGFGKFHKRFRGRPFFVLDEIEHQPFA